MPSLDAVSQSPLALVTLIVAGAPKLLRPKPSKEMEENDELTRAAALPPFPTFWCSNLEPAQITQLVPFTEAEDVHNGGATVVSVSDTVPLLAAASR